MARPYCKIMKLLPLPSLLMKQLGPIDTCLVCQVNEWHRNITLTVTVIVILMGRKVTKSVKVRSELRAYSLSLG